MFVKGRAEWKFESSNSAHNRREVASRSVRLYLWRNFRTAHLPDSKDKSLRSRLVIQIRPQPAFHFGHAHSLAARVVFHLVAIDLSQTEIPARRMRHVEPAHARPRPHRKRLGQLDARVLLHIEQPPQRALLRVIGARRIPRRRPDPAIFLVDQLIAAQLLARARSPTRRARAYAGTRQTPRPAGRQSPPP